MSAEPKTADDGSPYAYLHINTQGSGRPGDTQIRLSTGHQLGHVQAVSWSLRVDGRSKCVVETLLDPADLQILLADTTLKIELLRHPFSILWTYYASKFRWRVWYRWFPSRKRKVTEGLLKRYSKVTEPT